MTDEEIFNIIQWDFSKLSTEELINLTKTIKEEIESREKLLQIIQDAIDVNKHDLKMSIKYLYGKNRPSFFTLREEEYPDAIKKDLEEQNNCYTYTSNIIMILVRKLEELNGLASMDPRQFS